MQDVNQQIIPWFSDTDIQAGDRWGLELATRLENTHFGIICTTQEALESKWVMFEAGALGKLVSGGRVCPYLIDLNRQQLQGPLSQFQSKESNQEGTWELLQDINIAMDDGALPEERLKKYFNTFWPDLEATLTEINRELQPLPMELRRKLLESLPPIFYNTQEMTMYTDRAGVSVWKINWNQAALYAWEELIQVAVDENKLGSLLNCIQKAYEGNTMLNELNENVQAWEARKKV